MTGSSFSSHDTMTICAHSWFYDAPLSYLGLGQVEELALFLKKTPLTTEKDLVAVLRSDPGAPPSRILCSNLRRAISTMAAGFRDRLARRPEDKILIIPPLQEIRSVSIMIALLNELCGFVSTHFNATCMQSQPRHSFHYSRIHEGDCLLD